MSNGQGLEEQDYSEYIIKSVEIITASAMMLTPDGPFMDLPTMYVRLHYQGGDVGEALFDPVGVTILLDAVLAYIDQFTDSERERFDEYIKAMGKNVTMEVSEEE